MTIRLTILRDRQEAFWVVTLPPIVASSYFLDILSQVLQIVLLLRVISNEVFSVMNCIFAEIS